MEEHELIIFTKKWKLPNICLNCLNIQLLNLKVYIQTR
jgi:hypothetical protein